MGFIEQVLTLLDIATVAMAATAYANIVSGLLPVFHTSAVLVVTLIGVNLMIQALPMTLQNGLSLIVRISLATVFLSSWSNFDAVYGVLTNAPSEIGATILDSLGFAAASDGLYPGLDRLYEGSLNAGQAVAQNGGFIAGAISSVVVFVMAVLFSVVCVVVMGVAKIVLALMIVISPAAIICTLFRQTISFFEAWVRVSVQAALVPMLMAATAGVVLVIAQEVAPTDLSGVETIGDILSFLFVMMLGAFTVIRIPGLAETLSPANLGLGAIASVTYQAPTRLIGQMVSTTASGESERKRAARDSREPDEKAENWSNTATVTALAHKMQRINK